MSSVRMTSIDWNAANNWLHQRLADIQTHYEKDNASKSKHHAADLHKLLQAIRQEAPGAYLRYQKRSSQTKNPTLDGVNDAIDKADFMKMANTLCQMVSAKLQKALSQKTLLGHKVHNTETHYINYLNHKTDKSNFMRMMLLTVGSILSACANEELPVAMAEMKKFRFDLLQNQDKYASIFSPFPAETVAPKLELSR